MHRGGRGKEKAKNSVFTQKQCTVLPKLSVRRSTCSKYRKKRQQPKTG